MSDPRNRKQSLASGARPHHDPAAPSLPDYSLAIVETVREPLVLLDSGLRVLVANAAFYRAFGGSPADTRRRSLYDLAQGRWDAPELHRVLQALQDRDVAFENHDVRVTVDGKARVYQLNARRASSSDSENSTFLLAFEDVTELRRAEERLRDLARMEAIGQLAGGVAHEINNQMTVLIGFMLYVARDLAPDDPKRKDLAYAERAAEHVVYITRQLLNFSRKQMIKRVILDPWAVLSGMRTLLRRLLGSDIQVDLVRKDEALSIEVDEGQLGEILINLALNARYAMGQSGTFEVALSTVDVEEASGASFPGQPPGRYVRLYVRDTGTGMDEDTRRRAFEPFFTTKPIGEGTGLGLASVFGAVAQNGGFVRLDSRLGEGTAFTIEFPEVAPITRAGQQPGEDQGLPRGAETVIVAEDEEGVRAWVSRVLRDAGYTVLEARQGEEALRLYADHAADVRLVLTDLVMSGVSGRAVGKRMAEDAPQVPVLYMSGYAEDEILRRQLVSATDTLLRKPFSAEELLQRVRAALDSVAGRPGR